MYHSLMIYHLYNFLYHYLYFDIYVKKRILISIPSPYTLYNIKHIYMMKYVYVSLSYNHKIFGKKFPYLNYMKNILIQENILRGKVL